MAYILAIETSGAACSVALFDEETVIGEIFCAAPRRHAAILPLQVQAVLEHCAIQSSDIQAIAVSSGPGSYTGLRIGGSTAKGLAFGWDLPIISLSSLQVLAAGTQSVMAESQVLAMFDALRSDVFTASYNHHNQVISNENAITLSEEWLNEQLSLLDSTRGIVIAGDGATKIPSHFPVWYAKFLKNANNKLIANVLCQARHMQRLAYTKWQAGDIVDAARFEPNYLKAFQLTVSTKKVL